LNTGEGKRRTEQGDSIDIQRLRGFLKRMLADDAVADKVDELLFAHVVEGRYRLSVIAETLPCLLGEVIGAAQSEDWQAITDEADRRGVRGGWRDVGRPIGLPKDANCDSEKRQTHPHARVP
jgi:hypothetical protein